MQLLRVASRTVECPKVPNLAPSTLVPWTSIGVCSADSAPEIIFRVRTFLSLPHLQQVHRTWGSLIPHLIGKPLLIITKYSRFEGHPAKWPRVTAWEIMRNCILLPDNYTHDTTYHLFTLSHTIPLALRPNGYCRDAARFTPLNIKPQALPGSVTHMVAAARFTISMHPSL